MARSPYLAPGFYDSAIVGGRHRDIVGGRWDETGRAQMAVLIEAGLQPHHRLLDIGAGSLRLGCKAVPYLDAGHYWATDASLALMRVGHAVELDDPARLPADHLVEDADFALPGIPHTIDFAMAWGVFAHLPAPALDAALARVSRHFPRLTAFLFTVFLAPSDRLDAAYRQPDGVVTHPDRPPWHRDQNAVTAACQAAGLLACWPETRLPRGQRLCIARPVR
jgi:hypothetical protein